MKRVACLVFNILLYAVLYVARFFLYLPAWFFDLCDEMIVDLWRYELRSAGDKSRGSWKWYTWCEYGKTDDR